MSLTQFIQNKFQPTNDQAAAFKAIERFLEAETKVFLLKGYAGTGKTTMTKYLADYLNHKRIRVVILAPTRRAARILQQKTGYESCPFIKEFITWSKLTKR